MSKINTEDRQMSPLYSTSFSLFFFQPGAQIAHNAMHLSDYLPLPLELQMVLKYFVTCKHTFMCKIGGVTL